MREKFSMLLAIVLLGGLGYVGYIFIFWLPTFFERVDSNVGAALITVSGTAITTVLISSYNSRRAKERVAFEAHREKKAEIYNQYMDMVVQIMRNSKDGKTGDDVIPAGIEEFFYSFTPKIAVYGGPGVVKAYADWRSASSADQPPQDALLRVDAIFRAMRVDLGESNKGLAQMLLVGLFIRGNDAKKTSDDIKPVTS